MTSEVFVPIVRIMSARRRQARAREKGGRVNHFSKGLTGSRLIGALKALLELRSELEKWKRSPRESGLYVFRESIASSSPASPVFLSRDLLSRILPLISSPGPELRLISRNRVISARGAVPLKALRKSTEKLELSIPRSFRQNYLSGEIVKVSRLPELQPHFIFRATGRWMKKAVSSVTAIPGVYVGRVYVAPRARARRGYVAMDRADQR